MKKKTTLYIKDQKEISFCGNSFIQLSCDEYTPPYEIKQSIIKHNFKDCKSCQEKYKEVLKNAYLLFKNFPICCKHHRNLKDVKHFNRSDFDNSPYSIADKTLFFYNHVIEFINEDNWEDEIKQYFEYCIDSFGKMPEDCGEPFFLGNYYKYVLALMRGLNESESSKNHKINSGRLKKIIDFIEYSNSDSSALKTDFNLLLSIYDKWFKIFPFDLEYFKGLKSKYSKIMPFHTGVKKYNKYLGNQVAELHTQQSLTNVLIELTKSILASINGLVLYKKGELYQDNKIELSLIIKSREIELEALIQRDNRTHSEYIQILKKWLKSEKQFIQDIKPFLIEEPKPITKNKVKSPTVQQWALYYYYLQQAKDIAFFEHHSVSKSQAIRELVESIPSLKSVKNFENKYNKIAHYNSERIAFKQVKNIEYVIEYLLKDYPKAKEIAISELELAKAKKM